MLWSNSLIDEVLRKQFKQIKKRFTRRYHFREGKKGVSTLRQLLHFQLESNQLVEVNQSRAKQKRMSFNMKLAFVLIFVAVATMVRPGFGDPSFDGNNPNGGDQKPYVHLTP